MTEKMLAYIGWQEGEEWCMPVHGETRGKAKANFMKWSPDISDLEFFLIRLIRFPALDDKPFTPENLNASDWHYIDFETDEPISNDLFINDCRCAICRPSLEPWQKQTGEMIEELNGKKVIQRPR